jgi:hypothetical protein
MPHKRDTEHPDDLGIDLAPPVTPAQRRELVALRYRGPWPSTAPQAAAILRTLHEPPAPGGETEVPRQPP